MEWLAAIAKIDASCDSLKSGASFELRTAAMMRESIPAGRPPAPATIAAGVAGATTGCGTRGAVVLTGTGGGRVRGVARDDEEETVMREGGRRKGAADGVKVLLRCSSAGVGEAAEARRAAASVRVVLEGPGLCGGTEEAGDAENGARAREPAMSGRISA